MEKFKLVKKLVLKTKEKIQKGSRQQPIREFQAVADDIHTLFGWRRKKSFIYALASKFKKPRDLYDLAKSEVYDRGLRGTRAFKYLLGVLKIKTK